MSDAASPPPVCSRCGKDCSTTRRAKDAKGRYICGDCLDKAKAAAPKPAAPDPNADMMSRLIADSPRLTQPSCPNCGDPYPTTAKICTHCGYNRDTGKSLKTRFGTVAAPKDKNKK